MSLIVKARNVGLVNLLEKEEKDRFVCDQYQMEFVSKYFSNCTLYSNSIPLGVIDVSLLSSYSSLR